MPTTMAELTMKLIGPCAALFLLSLLIRTLFSRRRRRREKAAAEDFRRCKCGYPLTHLTIPRCPECGRVVGFDRTFAELGISEEEVRRHVEEKRTRSGA